MSRIFGKDAVAFARRWRTCRRRWGSTRTPSSRGNGCATWPGTPSSTDAAFLYGRLHALEEAGAEQSQRHFDDAWKAAGRKRLHRWLR